MEREPASLVPWLLTRAFSPLARAAAPVLQATLEAWFEAYDKDKDGKFNKDEMGKVLTEVKRKVTADPAAEVKDEMVTKIFKLYDFNDDHEIERSEVLRAVKKYRFLLKHNVELESLFEKHDTNHDGALDRDELMNALIDISEDGPKPSDGDLDFVLKKCDKDESGTVSIDELGPAVATWKEIAKNLPEKPEKSAACVLL